MMDCFTPLLLLGFNRPEMLRAQVTAIAPFRPERIYLAVDGPRSDHLGDAEKCAVCAAVLDHPARPCKVKKLVRTENLGCKRAEEEALDWFLTRRKRKSFWRTTAVPVHRFSPMQPNCWNAIGMTTA